MATPGHILAIGGGGFTLPEHVALFCKMLELSGKAHPRACFIGTASGDEPAYAATFLSACAGLGVAGEVLRFFPQAGLPEETAERVASCDVFYVGGGNTRNLVTLWREYGLDAALKQRWESGAVLGGSSAGGCCWFETCVTDSMRLELDAIAALGWLPGGFCPHFDSEGLRRPRTAELFTGGELQPGVACDDNVGAWFSGTDFQGFLSAKPGAQGWRLKAGEPPEAMVPQQLYA
ncbi:MAG: Type 1 glutamine amidotransferase-like domain-containing protein [Opitutales bacterium]